MSENSIAQTAPGTELDEPLVHPYPIVVADIQQLVDNYKKTMTAGDATSAWIPRTEVENLLNQNKDATGIHLYYGRHDDDGTVYANKHTIIFVATKSIVAGDPISALNSVDILDPKIPVSATNATVYTNLGNDRIPLCLPNCPAGPIN